MNENKIEVKNKNEKYSAIDGFGVTLIISIILMIILSVSSHLECLNNYTDNDLCGLGPSLFMFFIPLPLGLIGSLGVIISAIIKRRRYNFGLLDKIFITISVLFLAIAFIYLVGYTIWEKYFRTPIRTPIIESTLTF